MGIIKEEEKIYVNDAKPLKGVVVDSKEIEKRYEGMGLKEIIGSNMFGAITCEKEFIEALYYLDFKKLFRKDKRYKKASFEEYISDRFDLSYQRYRDLLKVYGIFPQEADKYGIGAVRKAIKMMGLRKAEAVFKLLKKKEEQKGELVTRKVFWQLVELNKNSPDKV